MCLEQFGPLIAHIPPPTLKPQSLSLPHFHPLSRHTQLSRSLSLVHTKLASGGGRRRGGPEAVGGRIAAGCGRPASGARRARDGPVSGGGTRRMWRPACAGRGKRKLGRPASSGGTRRLQPASGGDACRLRLANRGGGVLDGPAGWRVDGLDGPAQHGPATFRSCLGRCLGL